MKSALSYFTEAVFAYHEQSYETARQLTGKAAVADPKSLFYQQAKRFVHGVIENESSNIYASPKGFEAFVRGGGNVPLYTNTSARLNKIYTESGAATLLDIGVGDGHALVPALSENLTHLDCVEPSVALLKTLGKKLAEHDIQFQLHPNSWQEFEKEVESRAGWDIIQMTFSAHTFLPDERAELLGWCAKRCKQLLLVEFDAPIFSEMLTPEVIAYYVAKYELGLAEYADYEIVMQRFLMPVFFGNFAHDSERLTFEQPADNWQADLKKAGFTSIQQHAVFDYWWAPAFMLQAEGKG
ncbi:MAG: hypothetical protein ACI9EW_004097 [Cellvibrionaceae bacterium]|jgi:hypothetical protein